MICKPYAAAFSHHELNETPLVPDSANCALLSDPIVSALLDRDITTGLPSVRLTWTPLGGATAFDVYRNTRAGDGFLPIARNVSGGPVFDSGVQVGATYRYFVAAVRRTGCAAISPGANIVTVAINAPDLRIFGKTLTEVAGASDGDGRIEPGERVRVNLTLQERGGALGTTGITASVTSASSFSRVTSAGPVSYGSVSAGGTASSSGSFEVFLGPTEGCGGRVHLVASISGNEGCWLDSFDIAINPSGCAVSPSAFVEVVPGSVQIVSNSGDGDGVADNCETTMVNYQIRNAGSAPSGPATGTVTTTHPGVTFAPAPLCAVANLNGGAAATCKFRFSLGGATSSGVPFTLTAGSAGNAGPSRLQVTLAAETDPPVFSTQTFGFEGSFQGWTSQNFDLSGARSSSGAQSAHAGSTTVNNICARLTSPAFLLSPTAAPILSFQMFADIEPITDQWYDRANVHLVDIDSGQHALLLPGVGPDYNAFGNPQGGLCHVPGENGWAGDLGGFQDIQFDLSPYAGRRVRIEINYDTDEGDDREGLYIDGVSLTNAASALLPADPQGNTCTVPEVSPPAAPVPLRVQRLAGSALRFTWEDLGPGIQYNLYSGTLGSFYDHGAGALSCSGLGAGMDCNSTVCTFDAAAGGVPAGNRYFVVTATGFGAEGTSGFASSSAERPPAQSSCLP